jgi:hypothetical protein
MKRLLSLSLVAFLALFLLATGCSKKNLPGAIKAIPADADLVVTLDAKAMVTYAKQVLAKVVPADMKDKIPTVEMLLKQAAQLVGVDLDKLSKVTVIGYVGSQEKMAVIAEGLTAAGMKGEKTGERNGVATYAIAGRMHYADLAGLGLAVAPSPEMLGQVIDAFTGKAKNIGDTDRGKLLEQLSGSEKDLDQLRAYLLTGSIPGQSPDVPVKGGAFLLHLDKGATALIVSDSATVDKISQGVTMGLAAASMGLAMGGKEAFPVPIDDETKAVLQNALKNISSKKEADSVSINYRGDLKPILEKGVAMALKSQYQPATDEVPPPAVDVRPAEEKPAAAGDGTAPAPVRP